MATNFHISTIAFSVRNALAMFGQGHPVAITQRLKKVYMPTIDEEEVRHALHELERRELVTTVGPDLYAAKDRAVYHHRAPAPAILRDDDETPWKGWR